MLRLLILLLPVFLLTSCIDYEEHFTVRGNGSGSIQSVITVRGDIADEELTDLQSKMERLLDRSRGLHLTRFRARTEGKERITEFTIEFDHVRHLKEAIRNRSDDQGENLAGFLGTFSAEARDDRFIMTRTVDLSSGLGNRPLGGKRGLRKAIGNRVMSNYTFVYHMHFPTEVLRANAGSVQPETNSVTWQFPLSLLAQGPMKMEAEVAKPPLLKWGPYFGGGLIAFVFLTGMVLRHRSPLFPFFTRGTP